MNHQIKTYAIVILAVLTTFAFSSCDGGTSGKSTSKEVAVKEKRAEAGCGGCSSAQKSDAPVKVYYFHATRRCATCQAVEKVSKEAIKNAFGEKVTFISVNKDTEKDNPMIEKYHISGQKLLVIQGDKVEDLTNLAFMNARTHPEKLESKLVKTIQDKL
ncbi:nitrophenyl compound nitroreductase subunit ArsF family protein [Halosquirtibacter laminarini]|uniref:Nitrophenyl compound nitroreductase subunit ArsF family protein n=1 Tax=Halosquirtibacter laminarini TaxID=3374600 RepID=A0AC61NRC2_9BACT|nr:nitrophenyl compound nitroreductase subunit ArsF family protein [Prolixibacteraceae bacterium]